ncbi:MAG: hypothetical protein ACLUJG_07170 [Lawsonibacter sp.]
MSRDIVKLADVLGHSCIETTRIYLMTSGTEHQRQLERLGLVSWSKFIFRIQYHKAPYSSQRLK